MLRLNIKNSDGTIYGYMDAQDQAGIDAYVAACTEAGSYWTIDRWTRLDDGDPRINDKIASRTIVSEPAIPAVMDESGQEMSPAKPEISYKEYNLGCYLEIEDLGLAPLLAEIRQQRNELLAACDYTQLADSPLSAEQKQAWAEYRQALRDITKHVEADGSVVWPQKPA